ncbi:precorrin-2 dehydrogenase/sirohydrochlorin ferrochelatase family protein [Deferribacter abyssi]|uniref:precorrin-2 dehydrogenase/sirohydrochlorin ferrochelatase family protein n=1 Tax=Deferribacter abyssi TaxID=213806 RepID=UPI003C213FE9
MFKLTGKKVVSVGGGKVASRKIRSLLTLSMPAITVVSDRIDDSLKKLCDEGKIYWIRSKFDENVIDEKFDFAFICTNDKETNERAADFFIKKGIPVNVCDDKELSTFFMPAVFEEKDFVVAISTKGKSPTDSKEVKELLKNCLKKRS